MASASLEGLSIPAHPPYSWEVQNYYIEQIASGMRETVETARTQECRQEILQNYCLEYARLKTFEYHSGQFQPALKAIEKLLNDYGLNDQVSEMLSMFDTSIISGQQI
jgi:hypothetical protein